MPKRVGHAWSTEKSMHYHIYNKRKDSAKYLTKNKYIFTGPFGNWETDSFELTKSRVAISYEIKISRSDFVKDAKYKADKHDFLIETWESKGQNLIDSWEDKKATNLYCPNKFIFAVPEGLVEKEEIEEKYPYAGLLWVYPDGKVKTKRAKKLHPVKQDLDHILIDKFYHEMNRQEYASYMLAKRNKEGFDPQNNIDKFISDIKLRYL